MDFQEFPKCLYRGDEPLIVADEHEEAAAREGGFRFWSDAEQPDQEPAKRGPGRPKKTQ